MTDTPAMRAATLSLVLDKAVPFVASCEGCRLSAYYPTPSDRPTIGYGATFYLDGLPVKIGQHVSQPTADAMLRATLAIEGAAVMTLAGPSTTCQLAAMLSLAFNIGNPAFAHSTVLRLHLAGDYAGAARHFADWNKQAGTVLPGLVNRRRREAALYLSKS